MSKTVQLRHLARIVNGGTPTPDPDNWEGSIPWATPVDLGRHDGQDLEETIRTLTEDGLRTGSASVSPGSVIISTRAPVGYVARTTVQMAFNQGCKGLELRPDVDSRFMVYAMKHLVPEMRSAATGTTFLELSTSKLASLRLPLLPIETQRAIADFLDQETSQIDAMIEAQESLRAGVIERRSALITHAVLGGFENGSRVDSGNTHIGEVPSAWQVSRFGRHTRINDGLVDPTREPWSEMVLIAPNHVQPGTGRIVHLETADAQGADSGKYLVKAGQIIYSKIRPALNKVSIAPQDVLCSADMYGISCLNEADYRYFKYFMLARPFHEYATMQSDRVKMPKVNREELNAAPWVIPPLGDQVRIADQLDNDLSQTDQLLAETERVVSLLRERREALITAAVTGRIDPETGIEYPENPETPKEN